MCASGQATSYTTTPPSTATLVCERVNWRVEWCSVVFSDESRFCLCASDGRTCVRHRPRESHLPVCIHLEHTGLSSGFMVWGAIIYNSQSHLVFLKGEINSTHYIAQVVNPVLLPVIQQKGDVLFQHDNERSHMAAAMQHALYGIKPGWGQWIFSEHKNPEYDFLQKGNKAIGPVSYIYGT